MNAIVKVNPKLPAVFQQAGAAEYDEFKGGVVSGFPVISFRGRVWRVKKGGDEQVYLNDEGESIQSIEGVMIRSNPILAKIFYDSQYTEGDSGAPRCWSGNGIKPDIGVTDPISKLCATCPNNQWGSKITPSGAKTRACADHRRMAFAFRHDIESVANGEVDESGRAKEVTPLLLRVPAATLNPLKEFVEKILQPKGVPPFAVFVKIGFDTTVSYPKLTFRGAQFLNDAQGQIVMQLRESEDVKRILAEATEYSAAGTTGEADEGEQDAGDGIVPAIEAASPPKTTKPTPAASTKPRVARKPTPVEEEEAQSGELDAVGDDNIAPAAEPVDDDIAPPAVAKPAKVAKPAAVKPAAKAKPVPAQEAEHVENPSGEGDQSFEQMLDSLLDD